MVEDAPPDPRRLHPLTPLATAARIAPVLVLVGLANQGSGSMVQRIGIGGTILLVLMVTIAVVSWLQWRAYRFWFDDGGDLRIDSGVLRHSRRKLQLSRLQSVEVNQPFFARVFGLAEVTVEVAGAGESKVTLRYLGTGEADGLRNELLARAAGVEAGAPAAPERVLTVVPTERLLLSLLLRFRTVVLLTLSGLFLLSAYATGGAGALVLALVTGGLPVFGVISEFLAHHGFTVAESPDGLRVRHGLATTVANTVPPGRVHAVGFTSGPIWRRLGWVRVYVDLGGSPGGGNQDRRRNAGVLLPVATWDVARDVVSRVMPGADPGAREFTPVPRRARWRSPVQWSRVGWTADDRVFMARRGRLEQWWTVVPHGRVQSLRVVQGPWQRRLGVAELHLDTVPGPVAVRVPQMDVADATRVAEAELDLAAAARAAGGPLRWMSPPPTDPTPSGPAPSDPAPDH